MKIINPPIQAYINPDKFPNIKIPISIVGETKLSWCIGVGPYIRNTVRFNKETSRANGSRFKGYKLIFQ